MDQINTSDSKSVWCAPFKLFCFKARTIFINTTAILFYLSVYKASKEPVWNLFLTRTQEGMSVRPIICTLQKK